MKILATLLGVLLFAFVLLAILIPALTTDTQAAGMRIAVFEYGRLRAQAEKGDIGEAAAALKNVQAFWPTKVSRDGKFASIVAALRDSTVREIITRMRSLSGEDLGNDPEPWLKTYYKETRTEANQQAGANRRQPVGPDTNSASAAAASGRSP